MPWPRSGSDALPVHRPVDSTGQKLCGPGAWLTENLVWAMMLHILPAPLRPMYVLSGTGLGSLHMQRYWAQSGDWNDQGQRVPGTYRLTIEASDLSAATAEVDRRLAEGDHRCFDCGSAVRVFNDRESSWRTLEGIDATWSTGGARS